MFRNSIKEEGEPSLEASSLPRRDSLSRLHEAIKSASVDGYVRERENLSQINTFCHRILFKFLF